MARRFCGECRHAEAVPGGMLTRTGRPLSCGHARMMGGPDRTWYSPACVAFAPRSEEDGGREWRRWTGASAAEAGPDEKS